MPQCLNAAVSPPNVAQKLYLTSVIGVGHRILFLPPDSAPSERQQKSVLLCRHREEQYAAP